MSLTKLSFAALTDVGVKRSHNQDACRAVPAADEADARACGHLFIVADGMGGHAVGEKASAKAVQDIPLSFRKYVRQDGVAAAVRRAFTEANADIYDIGVKNPEFKGLGTTATAVILRPEGVWVGHVGDSRAYRIRGGRVEQLTFDHSWVWEIARRQGIDPDQLGDFKRNVIIRSLGPDSEVEVDVEGPHPIEPGDAFLLCSDGLSGQVSADEMGAAVASMPPEEAAKFLIDLANVRGGPDNITCLIVRVPGPGTSVTHTPLPPNAGPVRRAATAWAKYVPWSYTALLIGIAAAVGSLLLRNDSQSLAVTLFVAAAVLIVAGIAGLAVHFKKASATTAAGGADAPGELHVYKAYPFAFDPPLFAKLDAEAAPLNEVLRAKDGVVDWAKYEQLTADAAASLSHADPPAAYRSRCQAFQMLAAAFNKDRSKEEAFLPNWKSPGT